MTRKSSYNDYNLSFSFLIFQVVTRPRDCASVVKILFASQPPVISLDGEGVNIGPNGPLTLLQIASWDGQIYIFDIQTCPLIMTEGGLRDLLTSEDIIKVLFILIL